MNRLIFLILFTTTLFSQEKLPEKLTIENYKIQIDSAEILNVVKELKKSRLKTSGQIGNSNDFYELKSVNKYKIQNKQIYVFDYSENSRYRPFDIVVFHNQKPKIIGRFSFNNSFFCKELKNGYPIIINSHYDSHKTNHIPYIEKYSFNENEYVKIKNSKIYHKDIRNKGLEYYNEKQYSKALIYFESLLSKYWYYPKISSTDYNNLAITYYKLNRFNEALNTLLNSKNVPKFKDHSTYFNLYLIEYRLKNKTKALSYLEKSNNLKRTDYKSKKITELKQ